jgi:hypothetical protein
MRAVHVTTKVATAGSEGVPGRMQCMTSKDAPHDRGVRQVLDKTLSKHPITIQNTVTCYIA